MANELILIFSVTLAQTDDAEDDVDDEHDTKNFDFITELTAASVPRVFRKAVNHTAPGIVEWLTGAIMLNLRSFHSNSELVCLVLNHQTLRLSSKQQNKS